MNIKPEYVETITRFLIHYNGWIAYQLQALDPDAGFQPIPEATLAKSGLAKELYFIASAAASDLPRDDDEEHEEFILSNVADITARLYYAPGIGNVDDVDVPDVFWEHPLGEMCARALLWALEGELITLQEAADTARVSVQAVSQAVAAGRIAGYVDPDAAERQGRILVKRIDVQYTKWRRKAQPDTTNRYRKPEKRQAYEAALHHLQDLPVLDYAAYLITKNICTVDHNLSEADARDVAAKAIRVERGRRRQLAIEAQTDDD